MGAPPQSTTRSGAPAPQLREVSHICNMTVCTRSCGGTSSKHYPQRCARAAALGAHTLREYSLLSLMRGSSSKDSPQRCVSGAALQAQNNTSSCLVRVCAHVGHLRGLPAAVKLTTQACEPQFRDAERMFAGEGGNKKPICGPGRCGLGHQLEDEDVVQIVKKKVTTGGEEGRGRFKTTKKEPARIADREKKAALKT